MASTKIRSYLLQFDPMPGTSAAAPCREPFQNLVDHRKIRYNRYQICKFML